MFSVILTTLIMGQICYPPALVEPTVTHHLLNFGVEQNRVYIGVRFEDGYNTEIPVINEILPQITIVRNGSGQVADLYLDYAHGEVYRGGMVVEYKQPKTTLLAARLEPARLAPVAPRQESPIPVKVKLSAPKHDFPKSETSDIFFKKPSDILDKRGPISGVPTYNAVMR